MVIYSTMQSCTCHPKYNLQHSSPHYCYCYSYCDYSHFKLLYVTHWLVLSVSFHGFQFGYYFYSRCLA